MIKYDADVTFYSKVFFWVIKSMVSRNTGFDVYCKHEIASATKPV